MSTQSSCELDPQTLVAEFKRFEDSVLDNQELLQHVADLSSRLPKVSDSTLFEIDDLIYGEDANFTATGSKNSSEETIEYLVRNCFDFFYDWARTMFGKNRFCRDAMMVFLQLLELIPSRTFNKITLDLWTLESLIEEVDPDRHVEHFLKLFKVIVTKHREVVQYQSKLNHLLIYDRLFVTSLLVLNLSENCEYGHPNEKRRSMWLYEQSKAILDALGSNKFELKLRTPLLGNYLETRIHLKENLYKPEFIWIMMAGKYFTETRTSHKISFTEAETVHSINYIFYLDHMHNYFMSAKDESERIGRVESFIKGLDMFKRQRRIEDPAPFSNDRLEFQTLCYCFTRCSKSIVETILLDLETIEFPPSVDARKLERRYGFDITSYLSEYNKNSAFMTFKKTTVDLMDMYFGNLNNTEDGATSDDSRGEREKASLYNKFSKDLQLLDVLHATWLMLEEEVKITGFDLDSYIAEVFRPHDSVVKKYIETFITKPFTRNDFHWWMQVLLKKCPFLFMSHRHESHMTNLIKMLAGRNIGDVAEEALYYIITSECCDNTNRQSNYPHYYDYEMYGKEHLKEYEDDYSDEAYDDYESDNSDEDADED